MFGSSRDSLAALQASLDSRSGVDERVSSDLLAVTDLLETNHTLRTTLNDTGTPPAARAGIVKDLLAGDLSPLGLDVVQEVVAARWSHDGDMVDALEMLGAQAALIGAQREGTLERVSDELFTFGRAVDSSIELRLVLTDPARSSQRKGRVVDDLLVNAAPATRELLRHTATHLRGRNPRDAIHLMSQLAARERSRVIAEITSAVDLSQAQRTRLGDLLRRMTGQEVRLNIAIDPALVGGMVVQIGDEVIDGSVATRLEQARRAMSA